MVSNSYGAIIALSRSKARYTDQDALLAAYVGCDGYTAKEIAVERLNWMYDDYADCPKRAHDLHKLGYLEQMEGRKCRRTGKVSHTYRISPTGLSKIVDSSHALAPRNDTKRINPVRDPVSARAALQDVRNILGGIDVEC